MRYGIFSMRWASASRGSVSGSRDLLIYPSARAQPTGSLTLKIYTPYEVFPRNEVSFVDRVDTVAHSGGQIPKTAFFLARRRGNICCDLDQRLRSNPVFSAGIKKIPQRPIALTVFNIIPKGCIVLNEHNSVFARSDPLYVIGLSWAHLSPERKRYLDRFRIFCRAH